MSLLTDIQKSQLDYVFKKDAANIVKTDNNSAPLSLPAETKLTSLIVPGSNVWAQSDILGQGATGAVNAGVAVKQTLVQLKSIHGSGQGTYALKNDGLSALYGVAWQAVDNSNKPVTSWVSPYYNGDYAPTFYHGTTSGSAQSFVSTANNPFVFDYTTGIFTFLNGTAYTGLTADAQPGISEFIYMTGYTYTGTTLSNFSSTYKYSESNIGLTGVTGNNYMTVGNNSTRVNIYSYGTTPSNSDTLLFQPSFDVTSSISVINFSFTFSSTSLPNSASGSPNPTGLLNAYIFIGIKNTTSGKYYGFILNGVISNENPVLQYFIGNGITQYPTSSPTWIQGFGQGSIFSITFTNSTIIYYINNNVVYTDKNKDILANLGSYKININDSIAPIGIYGISFYGVNVTFTNINLSSPKDGNIALGYNAGYTGQQPLSIAIGTNAGYTGQSFNSVAIGTNAGYTGQGAYAVAIGNNAGNSGQSPFSIALNATPTALNPATTGLFVKPIRTDTEINGNLPLYNVDTGEMFYNYNIRWSNGSGDPKYALQIDNNLYVGGKIITLASNNTYLDRGMLTTFINEKKTGSYNFSNDNGAITNMLLAQFSGPKYSAQAYIVQGYFGYTNYNFTDNDSVALVISTRNYNSADVPQTLGYCVVGPSNFLYYVQTGVFNSTGQANFPFTFYVPRDIDGTSTISFYLVRNDSYPNTRIKDPFLNCVLVAFP